MRSHIRYALLVLALGPLLAVAASFDCTKALSSVERLICQNPALSDLDEQLAKAYREKLAVEPELLRTEQRAWVAEVRNKCEDGGCLYTAYRNRVNMLTGNAEVLVTPSPPPMAKSDQKSNGATPAVGAVEASGSVGEPDDFPKPKSDPIPVGVSSNSSETKTTPATSIDTPIGDKWIWLQISGALVAVVVGVSIYRHKSSGLVIYSDYTDALVTGLAPLVCIVVFFALVYMNIAEQLALYATGFLAILFFALFARAAYVHNRGNVVDSLLSLVTKIAVIGVFYFAICFIIFGFATSARKKGERLDSYEARKRREAKASKAAMAAFAAGCVALVAWFCKRDKFVSMTEYITSDQTVANV